LGPSSSDQVGLGRMATVCKMGGMLNPSQTKGRIAAAILASWLLAGTLDIASAFILSASRLAPWQQMPKAIASGILGAQAFKGGIGIALLGLGLHYLIMLFIACACWLLASNMALARRQPIVFGTVFGIGVYAVMNIIVLPLSAIAFKATYTPVSVMRDLAIHAALVGWPMALAMQRMLWPSQQAYRTT
jgi:hypothetical protein